MAIIKVDNVSFSYAKGTSIEKKAIQDLSFSIEEGQFVSIIGHTGSGKSTLVQMLNGLIRPNEGTIYYNDKNIWEKPKEIQKIRAKVGIVFQYPEYQLFEETVRKDIAFGPNNMGFTEEEIEKNILEATSIVGLKKELLDKSPFELSGGEKRRVAIAGVLAMKPTVLVLDEPTAGLDPKGKDELLFNLYNYQKESKSTVILVSHNMEDVANITDKVLVLNKGKLAMYDNTKAVFSKSSELKSIGLDVPQITYIMSKLKDAGYPFSNNVITVQEAVSEIVNYLGRRGMN